MLAGQDSTAQDNIQFMCVHWLILLEKDHEDNHLSFIYFFNMRRPPAVTSRQSLTLLN